MAYIGFSPSQLAVAPFAVKSFTGDGSTTTFTLDQSVPGANEANVEVVVENVQQSPIDAYTIGGALNNSLIFSEAPVTGAVIYVIHKGESTYNLQPSTGSVTAATLDPVLRNFTVDNFTGNGSATTYTLTDKPYSAKSILVTVDGIVQTASTNYTVSGTTLSFGASAPDSGAVITVVHMGFSSGNKAVMDGSITPVKLSTGGPYWSTGGILAVGTTSPTSSSGTKLDVFSSTATISTAIRSAFSTGSAQLLLAGNNTTIGSGEFLISHDGSATAYLYNRSNTPMIFGTNNVERMRIDSSGNVGIGTNSPNTPLQVNGTIKSYASGVSNSNLVLRNSTTGDAAGFGLQQDGVNTYLYNNSNGVMAFATNGIERMRLDTAGLLTLPYGQIKFPAAQNASADANTLDDYEEGTFTAAISSGSGTVSTNSATGYYTKIGNQVSVRGYLNVSGVSSPSGTVSITGLPFVSNGTYLAASIYLVGLTSGATTSVQAYVQLESTYISVIVYNAGARVEPGAYFQAGAQVMYSATYNN